MRVNISPHSFQCYTTNTASIHISLHVGRWHLSFNYDDNLSEPNESEVAEWLMQHSEDELSQIAVGLDRGVSILLAGSDAQAFGFSRIQQRRMRKQERYKKRWQHMQARCVKGSNGWFKAKCKVAKFQRYAADVRRDTAHHISYQLATNPQSPYKLFIFEALQVKSMTKRAKPKQDENGRWLRNGASAKSGLNKSVLGSIWGQVKTFTQYKAKRQGKLVVEIPAQYTSQECTHCGYIYQDNRKTQSEFVCLSCGHQANADYNAANVIKKRGVRYLLSGQWKPKGKKRIAKNKVGAVYPEPIVEMQSTPSEIKVSRGSGNTTALWSLTSETHATTLKAFSGG